jgi:hypothetical protein
LKGNLRSEIDELVLVDIFAHENMKVELGRAHVQEENNNDGDVKICKLILSNMSDDSSEENVENM